MKFFIIPFFVVVLSSTFSSDMWDDFMDVMHQHGEIAHNTLVEK